MALDTTRSWPSNRSLLLLPDLSRDEFDHILDLASDLKASIRSRATLDILRGRIVALLFETPSTRTRVSFEAATLRLGGSPMYLQADRLKLGGGEPAQDTGRVLSEYCDCLVARVWPHETLTGLAKNSKVPLINACTDIDHPTQAICDLFTVAEAMGSLRGLKMTFVGTGNNMCNALMFGCAMAGMEITVACPEGLEPAEDLLHSARGLAAEGGTSITISHEPMDAVADADVIYTDIWEVPGREDLDIHDVGIDWSRFQLNRSLLSRARLGAKVMHCGDAERGKEITAEMMVAPESLIWDQADNKLYGGAAVLQFVLGGPQ